METRTIFYKGPPLSFPMGMRYSDALAQKALERRQAFWDFWEGAAEYERATVEARRSQTICCPDLAWVTGEGGLFCSSVGHVGSCWVLLGRSLLGLVLGRGPALEPGRASPNRGCQRPCERRSNQKKVEKKKNGRKGRTKTTPKKKDSGPAAPRVKHAPTRQSNQLVLRTCNAAMLPCPSPLPSRPPLHLPAQEAFPRAARACTRQ